jgi:uncharacterized membrane protein (UPF0127 family)
MRHGHTAAVLLAIFTLVSCGRSSMDRTTLSVNGRPLAVEVARTRAQRTLGLMHREELAWNQGMLFVFRKEQYLSFWMKDTSIPLEIAYLDGGGTVTDIYSMTPYSLAPVTSRLKARYALEVNQGFFEAAGLEVGGRVDLSDVPRRLLPW